MGSVARAEHRSADRISCAAGVFPPGRTTEIATLCQRLASLSPQALAIGKEAIYAANEMEAGAALKYLREASVLVSRTEDAKEGITAFFDKRDPRWTGR